MAKKTLVVWASRDEVLVCLKEDEPRLIKEYFDEGGRDKEEYARYETGEVKDDYAVVVNFVNSGSLLVNTG